MGKSKYLTEESKKFFNKIDSHAKAYILGFIYADGCNRRDKNTISINLHQKDVSILEFIKSTIGYTGSLYYYTCNDSSMVRLSLCSKYMCQALHNLGATRRKTFTLTFPTEDILPKEFQHSFMLGYFDGDGCIYFKEGTYDASFSIVGTEEFCLGFQKVLIDNCNLNKTKLIVDKRNNLNNIRTLVYKGSQMILKIFKFLYQNEPFCLKRKKDKFLSYIHSSSVYYNNTQIKHTNNFICVNDLRNSVNSNKMRPYYWKRLPSTKLYLKNLCKKYNTTLQSLFITSRGTNKTYVHPDIALKYAEYLDINLYSWLNCNLNLFTSLKIL